MLRNSLHKPLVFSIATYCRACTVVLLFVFSTHTNALEVTVDYRYDTNGFFNPGSIDGQKARAALEAAADRFSAVIEGPTLGAVNARDNADDVRIGFTHPSTGGSFQVSSAVSLNSDSIFSAGGPLANEYRNGITIGRNEWVLYAGGRPLSGSAGIGGTGTGTNFETIFAASNSILNRGFRSQGSVETLPVWGGAISFDTSNSRNWHFDHNASPVSGTVDLYSIALHEIGHALGLGTNWQDFDQYRTNTDFTGPEAVAAYNRDNGTNVSRLSLQSFQDGHWKDNEYESFIFPGPEARLTGTVGLNARQDLLMDPVANPRAGQRRFELTNVDVGALADIGWRVADPPVSAGCDFDGDNDCDIRDLDNLVQSIVAGNSSIADRDAWLTSAANRNGFSEPYLLGDANLDGRVGVDDLNVVGLNWTRNTGKWSQGDFNGSGRTDAGDLNFLGVNWQDRITAPLAATASIVVPEPSCPLASVLLLAAVFWRRRCTWLR